MKGGAYDAVKSRDRKLYERIVAFSSTCSMTDALRDRASIEEFCMDVARAAFGDSDEPDGGASDD